MHKRVNYVVCSRGAFERNTQKVRKAMKIGVDVLDVDYLIKCKEAGKKLPGMEKYVLYKAPQGPSKDASNVEKTPSKKEPKESSDKDSNGTSNKKKEKKRKATTATAENGTTPAKKPRVETAQGSDSKGVNLAMKKAPKQPTSNDAGQNSESSIEIVAGPNAVRKKSTSNQRKRDRKRAMKAAKAAAASVAKGVEPASKPASDKKPKKKASSSA